MKEGWISILSHYKENQAIVNVFNVNESEDVFWCGKILDYTTETMTIKHYTKFGKYDGIIIEKLENIRSIEFDYSYAKAMEIMIENHFLLDAYEEFDLPTSISHSTYDIIDYCFKNMKLPVISFSYYEEIYVGEILEYNTEIVTFKSIDNTGVAYAITHLKIEDIETIRIDDIQTRKRKLIYKHKKKK